MSSTSVIRAALSASANRNDQPLPAPIDFTRFGATPREVRLTREGLAMMIVAGAVVGAAIAIAIAMSVARIGQAAQAELLRREGVVTAARIVAWGRQGDEGTRRVTFDYTAHDASFRATGTLRQREWRRLAIGDTIPVRYIDSDPRRVWIAGHEPRVMPVVIIPLAAAGLTALAGLFVWSVQRQRTLLSEGRFAHARVVAMQKRSHNASRITYEFKTLSGATRVGRSDAGRRGIAVGTVVPVVYHREDPGRSALYPLSLVKPLKG